MGFLANDDGVLLLAILQFWMARMDEEGGGDKGVSIGCVCVRVSRASLFLWSGVAVCDAQVHTESFLWSYIVGLP